MKVQQYKRNNYKFSSIERLENIKKNFENNLNLKLNKKKIPIISVCTSGGGFRSMLATLGALEGLQRINLLDSIYFLSTLSGSSWAVLPWVLSGKNIIEFNRNFSSTLDKFSSLKDLSKIDFNKLRMYKKFFLNFYNLSLKQKKLKLKSKQEFGFVDLYGIFVSLIIFDEFNLNISDLNLYDLVENTKQGIFPHTIFSATSQLTSNKYEWFEFTPYYLGSKYINYSLDTMDSNINIISLLGILGSSFSGSFKDILKRFLQLPLPTDFIDIIEKAKSRIESADWGSKRIGAAYLDNFTYGFNDSPIKNLKKFPVFDGGYISHLPFETVLNQEVKSDIIFVIDNAGILPQTSVLKDTEEQLLKKGYKLPNIDYAKAKSQSLSIFRDDDKDVPTIVYVPLKKDLSYSTSFDPQLEKFCGTTNFFYSKKQAEMLIGLTRHVIEKNKNKLLDLLF